MRILRLIFLAFLSLFLLISITSWIASYFRNVNLSYIATDYACVFAGVHGHFTVVSMHGATGVSPGVEFHSIPLDSKLILFLDENSTAGFGNYINPPGNITILIFPCWLPTLLLALLNTLTLWRILRARKNSPNKSFPVASNQEPAEQSAPPLPPTMS